MGTGPETLLPREDGLKVPSKGDKKMAKEIERKFLAKGDAWKSLAGWRRFKKKMKA